VFILFSTLLIFNNLPISWYASKWMQHRNTTIKINHGRHHKDLNRGTEVSPLAQDFTIVFSNPFVMSKGSDFVRLEPFGRHRRRSSKIRYFGGLNILFLENETDRVRRREIFHDFDVDRGFDDLSAARQDDDDHHDYYYAFDDDYNRNPLVGWNDDKIQDSKPCRRNSWYRDLPINCNSIHEFGIQNKFADGSSKFLGCVKIAIVACFNTFHSTLIYIGLILFIQVGSISRSLYC
jgi:hypothetical protein